MSAERRYGWMWLQALELAEQAERLQSRFVRYLGPAAGGIAWEPPVDIYECGEELRLELALPGVAAQDIEIRLEGEALTVTALRRLSCPAGGGIRRLEIPYGRFVRRISLARAMRLVYSQYRDGCLKLHLMPAEAE